MPTGLGSLALFFSIHLIYLVTAVLFFRYFQRRSIEWSGAKRRLKITFIAAVLFSPGFFWYFAFPVPTFAALIPFFHLVQYFYDGAKIYSMQSLEYWVVYQTAASLLPIFLVWVLIFTVAQLAAYHRK